MHKPFEYSGHRRRHRRVLCGDRPFATRPFRANYRKTGSLAVSELGDIRLRKRAG